jgi:hypothetical protein
MLKVWAMRCEPTVKGSGIFILLKQNQNLYWTQLAYSDKLKKAKAFNEHTILFFKFFAQCNDLEVVQFAPLTVKNVLHKLD